jgi:chromatin remodeling complex protein RSC6
MTTVDKREINCDEKMKALVGLDKINCFSMNKYIGAHLIKPEEVPTATQ